MDPVNIDLVNIDRKNLTALRNTLSILYPTMPDSMTVAAASGLPIGLIPFQPAAVNNWEAILKQAQIREMIKNVVEAALADYPHHPVLKKLVETGEIVQESVPVIGTDLPWRTQTPASTLEKIMGTESTLLPITFLEVGLERSKSVARVKLEDGALGTGFLTANNIFVTNHHVLDSAGTAKGAVIQFNYQNNARGLDLTPIEVKLDPDTYFETSEDDDWTLVRVEGDANERWGKIDIKPIDDYKKIQFVNIIQHPAGGPKQIALYHNIVAYVDENRYQYLTDTLEGSSGSPVFDNRWRVVALHHSGGNIIEPGTKNPVFRNEGVNINLVADALKKMGQK